MDTWYVVTQLYNMKHVISAKNVFCDAFSFAGERQPKSVADIVDKIQDIHSTMKATIPQVLRLLFLILSTPVSVASAERSFSSLRRLKTWLRSSISQNRLSHVALMHVHKSITSTLDLEKLMHSFIERTPERRAIFGIRK